MDKNSVEKRIFIKLNAQQEFLLDYLVSIGYGGSRNRQDAIRAILDRVAFDLKSIEYANFVDLNQNFINYCSVNQNEE